MDYVNKSTNKKEKPKFSKPTAYKNITTSQMGK